MGGFERHAAASAADRVHQLTVLTQGLAAAVEPGQVATAVVSAGRATVGADAGFAYLLESGGTHVALVASESHYDYPDDQRRIPVNAPMPICDVLRRPATMVLSSREELLHRYPVLARFDRVASLVIVPFISHGRGIGGVALTFETPQVFGDEEREVLTAMVTQAAIALERSQSFEMARQAQERVQRAYELARAAERRKDEFLAVLGHELRNPLAPIVTALELLEGDEHFRARPERHVIERQVKHLVRLVDDLLDLSRITQGKTTLERRPIELAPVIDKAVETVGALLEQRGHELHVDVPPSGLTVNGDADRLTQVFANLLSNAAKYTPAHGVISVVGERCGGEARLSVSDTGIGMAAEVLPHVFDLFVQNARTVERAQGGLGIGLSLVRSFVEMHGGRVEAASAGLGRGSTFSVSLPLVSAAEQPAVTLTPTRTQPMGHGARVLIVDDNEDAAEVVALALERLGFAVEVAHDAPTALSLARARHFDAAILDIGLPVMDGYELARRLRDDLGLRDLRLIALSGYGQRADIERSAAVGFAVHLIKPVGMDALIKALARLPSAIGEGVDASPGQLV